MGSKATICEDVCKLFPNADHFYDLFGGGFSISHFMLKHRSKDFREFHYNEIRSGIGQLIRDAIAGKYSYENFKPAWVSREDFVKLKEKNAYIKTCWSFGNTGKRYLFGKDLEAYKKSMHMAVVFNEFDETARKIFGMEKFRDGYSITDKRLLLINRIAQLNPEKKTGQLKQLKQLQQLEQLEQLKQLERLYFHEGSYIEVPIKENSIVYCDIPYKGTSEYDSNSGFNRREFLDWAADLKEAVFISEYQIQDSRFKLISNVIKRSLLTPDKASALHKSEKVFVNGAGWEKLTSKSF